LKKSIKIILISVVVIIFAVGFFLIYQLFFLPKLTKLSKIDKPPFFSVDYVCSLRQVSKDTLLFGTESIPLTDLGGVIESDMKKIKDTGFEGVKLHFYFKNNNYIPERFALKAAKEGLYPTGILTGHNVKQRGTAFNDAELEEWKNFVREEVSASKNTIYFWEVWNEPDVDLFYYGTPEEYLSLLKESYKVIKEENPDAKVVVTLDAFDKYARDFSYQLLELGGGDYIDIISFHPYGANPYIQEEIVDKSITMEKEMVAKYGNKWPLWVSEIGQPTSEVSEERQAELAEYVLQKLYENDIPSVWFYYSDQRAGTGEGATGWGLLDSNGNPKPVFYKIKDFIEEAKKK
jgi:hypothetical protein